MLINCVDVDGNLTGAGKTSKKENKDGHYTETKATVSQKHTDSLNSSEMAGVSIITKISYPTLY